MENIQIQNPSKINILITHADLNASNYTTTPYQPISKTKLKQLGFDYIALGHIHKLDYQTEENQRIVYPGSTISMGFDELGKHGFIQGIIEKENLQLTFVPVDEKEFMELEVEISQIKDEDELVQYLNSLELLENNLYKIRLTGKRRFEIDVLNLYQWLTKPNIIKVKDDTKPNYELEELKNNYTLKGIFVQELLEEMQKENYTPEELSKILEIGFSVLEK